MAEIHVGVTVKLKAHIVDEDGDDVDVSAATTKQILLEAPGGTDTANTATFSGDGTDGYIEFTTLITTLDEIGIWAAQAYVVTPTQTLKSNIHSFEVKSNLQ